MGRSKDSRPRSKNRETMSVSVLLSRQVVVYLSDRPCRARCVCLVVIVLCSLAKLKAATGQRLLLVGSG